MKRQYGRSPTVKTFELRDGMPARRAFTLIELLAVVLIIGLLVGIMVPLTRYASERAERSRAVAELQRIAHALEEYRAHYGNYPVHYPAHRVQPSTYWTYRADRTLARYRSDHGQISVDTNQTSEAWVGSLWRRPQEQGRLPFLRLPGLEGMTPQRFDQATAWLVANSGEHTSDCPDLDDQERSFSLFVFVTQRRAGADDEEGDDSGPGPQFVRTARENPAFFDPWGNHYQYYRRGTHPFTDYNSPGSRFAYDLWSYGPDRQTHPRVPEHWIAMWKAEF